MLDQDQYERITRAMPLLQRADPQLQQDFRVHAQGQDYWASVPRLARSLADRSAGHRSQRGPDRALLGRA